MEKLFTFNKFFVGFCALLIAVVFASKIVSDIAVADKAKDIARDVFQWDWGTLHTRSEAVITEAKVLDRTDTDAKVQVTAKQTISDSNFVATEANPQPPGEHYDCKAILTFYRTNNKWELARVEIQ